MTILGVDVSHYQKITPEIAQTMYRQGIRFAWIKASEGTDYQDPTFESHYKTLIGAGILVGAYHFVRPRFALKQVANLLNVVGFHSLDLPIALDCEVSGIAEADVFEIANHMAINTGKIPCIYTNVDMGNRIFKTKEAATYPLWVAHWGVQSPTLPNAWKDKGKYLAWQYGVEDASKYGMSGKIDKDIWGNWKEFPETSVPPPDPPETIHVAVTVADGIVYEGDIPKKAGA